MKNDKYLLNVTDSFNYTQIQLEFSHMSTKPESKPLKTNHFIVISRKYMKFWLPLVMGSIFLGQILYFGFLTKAFGFSILVGTCFSIIGALSGTLVSPYDEEETKIFSNITTIVVSILSGYALAKIIDPLVDIYFKNLAQTGGDIAANTFVAVIGFGTAFVTVYILRAYSGRPTLNNPDKTN